MKLGEGPLPEKNMTQAQIAAIITLTGFGTDSASGIKSVVLGSGRVYSIQASSGSPGRYSVTFDDANGLVRFVPLVPASQITGISYSEDYACYDDVESIGIFLP
jgi:hypothetical protein